MTGGLGSTDAKDVLSWIRRNQKTEFREADVSADLRRFRATPHALTAALKSLVGAGAIRSKPEPHERGRHPSQAYEVHPDLLRAPENPGNTEIDTPSAEDGADSGISGISGRLQSENEATALENDPYAIAERLAIQDEGETT